MTSRALARLPTSALPVLVLPVLVLPALVLLSLATIGRGAAAADLYVDMAAGSDGYDGTSATFTGAHHGPWARISKACSSGSASAKGGDVVHVAATGTYVSSTATGTVGCWLSGAAGRPITFRGEGVFPNLTKIQNDGTQYSVMIGGSYQTWSNFDIGTSAPVAALFDVNNRNTRDCVFASPGGSTATPAKAPLSHLTVTGNVIHGCGGAAIDLFNSDYLTVSKNTIYGTAHTTTSAFGSALTILGAADSDANTGYKVVIDSNVIYANTNIPNCAAGDTNCLNVVGDLNGTGINLETNDVRHDFYSSGLYPKTFGPPYRGRMLVVNNLVYGNGGRCINIYRTKHVDVINNTCFHNLQDPYFNGGVAGEIEVLGGYMSILTSEPTLSRTPQYNGTTAISGGDVSIFDNSITANSTPAALHAKAPRPSCIAIAYTVQPTIAANNQCFLAGGAKAIASTQQFLYPGVVNTIDAALAGALFVDAGFRSGSINPAVADFRPLPNSALLGAGIKGPAPVGRDIFGSPRAADGATIGAIEQ